MIDKKFYFTKLQAKEDGTYEAVKAIKIIDWDTFKSFFPEGDYFNLDVRATFATWILMGPDKYGIVTYETGEIYILIPEYEMNYLKFMEAEELIFKYLKRERLLFTQSIISF